MKRRAAAMLAFLVTSGANGSLFSAETPLWSGSRDAWKMISAETRMIESDRRFGAAEIWKWRVHDASRPKPQRVVPRPYSELAAAAQPPTGALVLFAGETGAQWEASDWSVTARELVPPDRPRDLVSTAAFGSCRVHLEWQRGPLGPPKSGRPQVGSAGILFMSTYEVHLADADAAMISRPADACTGAIPGQYPPDADANRQDGEWQSLDVDFQRPLFNASGRCVRPARVTASVNGVRVLNAVELSGPTQGSFYRRAYSAHPDRLPLRLRTRHGNIRFRNVWLVPQGDRPVTADEWARGMPPAAVNWSSRSAWRVITAETRMIESDRRFGSGEMWRYRFNDPTRPAPRPVAPQVAAVIAARSGPPPGAIMLFDGKDASAWQSPGWDVVDGSLVVTPRNGSLTTRQDFGSCRLHVEWRHDPRPNPASKWESPGNSGIILMSTYEVQVLDHHGAEHLVHADALAGAVYGQYPPSVSPIRPPGEWQAFDLEFHRPHFDAAGNCIRPAWLSLDFNGVRVHDKVELSGPTMGRSFRRAYQAHPDRLPLELQNHNARVYYRNIWLVPLED